MENDNLLLKNLIGKDETKAQKAADYLIQNSDKELFKLLCDKSDFLFSFVRNNVYKRIEMAVTNSNFKNIVELFDYYSPYYDDLFALILAKHADEDLTDRIFELLEEGTIPQKTYAAKYFSYIPDTVALEKLGEYAFCDDDYLSANSAEALGQMQDDISFDIALDNLETGDDFDKLKAVKFFSSYGKNFPFKEIFIALRQSKMKENIAGQIPYMDSLLKLLETDFKDDVLYTIYYIIAGLGEILPFSDLFNFELFDVLNTLINENKTKNSFSSKIAIILLNALSEFKTFTENEEYIFDEDRETKNEINSILQLLKAQGKDFWNLQKTFSIDMLNGNDSEILAALNVIADFNIINTTNRLKELLNSENEIIVCETLKTLKILNAIDNINIDDIASRIKNPNIKALIEAI